MLVWNLDHWGRSVNHCIRSIQELVGLGIRFISATQNLDADDSNPTSRFMLHIFAAVAELESEMARDAGARDGLGITPASLNRHANGVIRS